MGLIYKQMKLGGNKGEMDVTVLFDTGASLCFVRKDVAEKVADISKAPARLKILTPSGTLETEEAAILQLWVDGHALFWTFLVLPELSEDLIVGTDFFQRWKIRLDPEREDIIIDPNALKLQLI